MDVATWCVCALNTFRCQGPGATWKSSIGRESRIGFICGPPTLLGPPLDTWVARELDVAATRDDHFPVVAKLSWHALPYASPKSWHVPIIDRTACVEGLVAELLRHALSQILPPPASTPVDAHHAYVTGVFQDLAPPSFPYRSVAFEKI